MNSFNKSHFVCPFHYLLPASSGCRILKWSLLSQAPSPDFYIFFLYKKISRIATILRKFPFQSPGEDYFTVAMTSLIFFT